MSGAAVVDASAVLTLLLSQAAAAAVRARLTEWKRTGTPVYVPSHFWLEVVNSLARRHRLPSPAAVAAIHALDEFGFVTTELSRPALLLALDASERHSLSLYDATYLALAESVDAVLLTSDRALLAAAGARGLPIDGELHRLADPRAGYEASPTWPRYREVSAFLAKLRAEAGEGVGRAS